MTTEPTTKITGLFAELDLTGSLPVVLIDGKVFEGVSRAMSEIQVGKVSVLVLRPLRFDVKVSELPCVMACRNWR